jgi:dimethylsulfoniopropionate demethylase
MVAVQKFAKSIGLVKTRFLNMNAPVLAVSRRTRRTPLSSRIEALGVGGYTVYNHMLLATSFGSPVNDYNHLKRNVQLWDVGCERQVQIQGPDAARLVQMMTVRDLSKSVVGQCLYVPLVDVDGSMINDPVALKLAEDRYWLSISDSDVLLWAKGLAYGLGLDVSIDEPNVWPMAVQGPKADDLMVVIFGEAVRDIRFFRFAELEFKGHSLNVARSGWSKQGGFEIYVDDPVIGPELWDALWDAGQAFDVAPGCPNLIERVEGGLLSYGNDMTREHNPLECGLDRYCQLDKDFESIGKAALVQIQKEGIKRAVRGLKISGDPVSSCVEAWPIHDGNKVVGQVTTAAYSPDFESNLAFAMLDRDHWTPGQILQALTPDGQTRDAVVSELPFTQDN